MHAGDGDAVFQAHQLSQHFRALNDGDMQFAGFGDFGIVGEDGGTGYDYFSIGDIFRSMSFEDGCAQSGQALCDG